MWNPAPQQDGRVTGGPRRPSGLPGRTTVLQDSIHQAHCPRAPVYDLRYSATAAARDVAPEHFHPAVARNTHLIMLKTTTQVSVLQGMFYQETFAAGFVAAAASGVGVVPSGRAPQAEKQESYEAAGYLVAAEVFKGAAGIPGKSE